MGKQGNRSGRSGPPKLPERLRALRGGGVGGEAGVDWPVGVPQMPEELAGEAAAEWGRVVGELGPRGVLSPLDRAALVILAEAWSDYSEAREAIERDGFFYETKGGRKYLNPWTVVLKDSIKTWSSMMLEFGLSPASRARLRIPTAAAPRDEKTERFFSHLKEPRK